MIEDGKIDSAKKFLKWGYDRAKNPSKEAESPFYEVKEPDFIDVSKVEDKPLEFLDDYKHLQKGGYIVLSGDTGCLKSSGMIALLLQSGAQVAFFSYGHEVSPVKAQQWNEQAEKNGWTGRLHWINTERLKNHKQDVCNFRLF